MELLVRIVYNIDLNKSKDLHVCRNKLDIDTQFGYKKGKFLVILKSLFSLSEELTIVEHTHTRQCTPTYGMNKVILNLSLPRDQYINVKYTNMLNNKIVFNACSICMNAMFRHRLLNILRGIFSSWKVASDNSLPYFTLFLWDAKN